MSTRFVVMDHGFDTGVYKICTHQTARLLNEFGKQNIEIFDSFEAAGESALLTVCRYDEARTQSQWRFSFRSNPEVGSVKKGDL